MMMMWSPPAPLDAIHSHYNFSFPKVLGAIHSQYNFPFPRAFDLKLNIYTREKEFDLYTWGRECGRLVGVCVFVERKRRENGEEHKEEEPYIWRQESTPYVIAKSIENFTYRRPLRMRVPFPPYVRHRRCCRRPRHHQPHHYLQLPPFIYLQIHTSLAINIFLKKKSSIVATCWWKPSPNPKERWQILLRRYTCVWEAKLMRSQTHTRMLLRWPPQKTCHPFHTFLFLGTTTSHHKFQNFRHNEHLS